MASKEGLPLAISDAGMPEADALTGAEWFPLVQEDPEAPGEWNSRVTQLDDIAEKIGANPLAMPAEWPINFTGDASAYIPAVEAMTISQGNAAIGIGTLSYAKSTAAAPDDFTTTSIPATLEAGAWLKVTAADVSGFKATHLVRSA